MVDDHPQPLSNAIFRIGQPAAPCRVDDARRDRTSFGDDLLIGGASCELSVRSRLQLTQQFRRRHGPHRTYSSDRLQKVDERHCRMKDPTRVSHTHSPSIRSSDNSLFSLLSLPGLVE